MVGVPAAKHLRGRLSELRALLSLGQDAQFVHLPLVDAFSNLNTTFMENTTFWLPEQDSLGNVVEDRASKAIFSLKKATPPLSFHLP